MNLEQVVSDEKRLQVMPAANKPLNYASFSKSTNQFASVATPSINNNYPLSFGGWFKLVEASSAGPLTVCGWSQSGSWGSTHILQSGYRIGTGTSATMFSFSSLELNEWLHLVVSYDCESTKFFKNGQQIHEAPLSKARLNNESQFRISSFNEGTLKYSSVDASRVFIVNRGLSQEDVMQLMNAKALTTAIPCLAEETLMNAWNINEGTGTSFASISTSKAPMTAPNGCTWKVDEN